MISKQRFIFAVLVASIAAGAPPRRAVGRTQYAPSKISPQWTQLGPSAPSDTIQFTFVLKSNNYDGLTNVMEQIALDGSPWLTEDQLATYVSASDEAKAAVQAAVPSFAGINPTFSATGDKLTVTATIGALSKFFDAQFNQYRLQGQSGIAHRTLAYTIPADLVSYVDDVYPIATFHTIRNFTHVRSKDSQPQASRDVDLTQRSAVPPSCNTDETTSACYRALYEYDTYTPKASHTSVGIIAYIGQNYNATDLATWITQFAPYAKGYKIAVNVSDGAVNDPTIPGIEAALDTQTITGIVYPIPTTFYDIDVDDPTGDVFLETFQNFLDSKAKKRPSVISISYGSDEQDFTSTQAETMCKTAQQLTALGTTIVVSSGDSGPAGQGDLVCPPFSPTYPSGCPYILSAGATENFGPEVMVEPGIGGFYSGAGFSNYFPTPKYQATQVAAYEKISGFTSDYNISGRGFPDIAAQGADQPVVLSGYVYSVGGTSCSAPIVSGGLTLLNNLLVGAGKSTVGWVHPKLYAHSSAFTDITTGGSFCGYENQGFPTSAGWDAPSGLGTPLFTKLRAIYGV